MADQHTYKFLPEDKCLSESQLFDYIDGKLKASDMHLIEKHILSCGFCSDALEGLEKVKHRDKVAAFVPLTKLNGQEEKKEEPKVIPLNPNKKYYAIAAGVVLILGITLFLKLYQSGDLSEAKVADLVKADTSSAMAPAKDAAAEKTATARMDSVTVTRENDLRRVSGEPADGKSLNNETTSPNFFTPMADKNGDAAPAPKAVDGTVAPSRSFDDDGDDFVNIVDAKATPEEQAGADYMLDEVKDANTVKQEQTTVLAEKKNKTISLNRVEKESLSKKADAQKPVATEDKPMTTVISSGATQVTATPTMTPPSSYTWTGPTATGSSTTITATDSTTIVIKPSDRDLDLSYENANKMLAAGQATASLALYDEVLKNPSHQHFQDAQWKKSEALLQLKRIDEAKKLLNEIAAKPGKYQAQAKEKLKGI